MTGAAVGPSVALRALAPQEASSTGGMVAEWSGLAGADRLAATWPQVYGPDARATRAGLFDGAALLAHAAVQIVALITGDGARTVALIGSVATDPSRRGRGLASRLLEGIAAALRAERVGCALLWSGRRELYERLGYRPAGVQHEVGIRAAAAAPAGMREARAEDLDALWRLHERKPLRVRRDRVAMELLLRCTRTFVLEQDGRVEAYACLGKGADFTGWWHELGGADAPLAALLPAATRAAGLAQATVLVPPYRAELIRMLGDSLIERRTGICALALPLAGNVPAEWFVDGLDSV